MQETVRMEDSLVGWLKVPVHLDFVPPHPLYSILFFPFFFFLINYTDEHGRSSCYLLEAIKVNFHGLWIPQTFESPTSSIMG